MPDESPSPEKQALNTIDEILRRGGLYEDTGLSLFLIMETMRGAGYPPYVGGV